MEPSISGSAVAAAAALALRSVRSGSSSKMDLEEENMKQLLTEEQESLVMEFMIRTEAKWTAAYKFLCARDFHLENSIFLYQQSQRAESEMKALLRKTHQSPEPYHLLALPLFILPGSTDLFGAGILVFNVKHWPGGGVAELTGMHWVLRHVVDLAVSKRDNRNNGITLISNLKDIPRNLEVADVHWVVSELLTVSMPVKLRKLLVVNSPRSSIAIVRDTPNEPFDIPYHICSSDELLNFVQKSCLPLEMGGSLYYNHQTWYADQLSRRNARRAEDKKRNSAPTVIPRRTTSSAKEKRENGRTFALRSQVDPPDPQNAPRMTDTQNLLPQPPLSGYSLENANGNAHRSDTQPPKKLPQPPDRPPERTDPSQPPPPLPPPKPASAKSPALIIQYPNRTVRFSGVSDVYRYEVPPREEWEDQWEFDEVSDGDDDEDSDSGEDFLPPRFWPQRQSAASSEPSKANGASSQYAQWRSRLGSDSDEDSVKVQRRRPTKPKSNGPSVEEAKLKQEAAQNKVVVPDPPDVREVVAEAAFPYNSKAVARGAVVDTASSSDLNLEPEEDFLEPLSSRSTIQKSQKSIRKTSTLKSAVDSASLSLTKSDDFVELKKAFTLTKKSGLISRVSTKSAKPKKVVEKMNEDDMIKLYRDNSIGTSGSLRSFTDLVHTVSIMDVLTKGFTPTGVSSFNPNTDDDEDDSASEELPRPAADPAHENQNEGIAPSVSTARVAPPRGTASLERQKQVDLVDPYNLDTSANEEVTSKATPAFENSTSSRKHKAEHERDFPTGISIQQPTDAMLDRLMQLPESSIVLRHNGAGKEKSEVAFEPTPSLPVEPGSNAPVNEQRPMGISNVAPPRRNVVRESSDKRNSPSIVTSDLKGRQSSGIPLENSSLRADTESAAAIDGPANNSSPVGMTGVRLLSSPISSPLLGPASDKSPLLAASPFSLLPPAGRSNGPAGGTFSDSEFKKLIAAVDDAAGGMSAGLADLLSEFDDDFDIGVPKADIVIPTFVIEDVDAGGSNGDGPKAPPRSRVRSINGVPVSVARDLSKIDSTVPLAAPTRNPKAKPILSTPVQVVSDLQTQEAKVAAIVDPSDGPRIGSSELSPPSNGTSQTSSSPVQPPSPSEITGRTAASAENEPIYPHPVSTISQSSSSTVSIPSNTASTQQKKQASSLASVQPAAPPAGNPAIPFVRKDQVLPESPMSAVQTIPETTSPLPPPPPPATPPPPPPQPPSPPTPVKPIRSVESAQQPKAAHPPPPPDLPSSPPGASVLPHPDRLGSSHASRSKSPLPTLSHHGDTSAPQEVPPEKSAAAYGPKVVKTSSTTSVAVNAIPLIEPPSSKISGHSSEPASSMSHLQSSFAPPISDTQRDKSPSPSKTAEIVQSGRLHVSKNGLSSAVDEVAMKSSDPASVASEGHSNPKRSSPEKPSDLAKKTDALQNLGASTPANVQENGVKLQIIQSSMQSGLTGVKPATAMEPRAGPFNPSGDARGVGRGRGLDPRRDTWPETSSLFISAGSIAPLLTAEPEDLEEDEPHTVSPPVAVSPSRSARSNHGSSERRASARLLKGAENSYEVTPRISNRTNQFKASDINRAQGHPSEEKPAVHSASDAAQSNGSDIPQPAPLENHIQAPPRSPSHKPVAKAEDAQEAHVFNYSSESQTALLQNTLSRRGSAGSASSSPNGFAFAPLHAEVSQFEREKADALRGDAKAAPVAQSTMQMPTEHLREFPIGSIPANSERMQFSDSLASAPPTRSPSSERRIDDARSVVPPLRSPSPKPIRESDKSKPNPSLGILAKVSKRTEVTTQNLRNDSVVAPPRSASPQPVNERDTRSVQPPPRSRNPQRISQLDAAQADEGSTFTQMKTAMQPPNTNIAGDTSVDTVKGMEAIKVTSTPPLNGALVAAPRRSLNPRPIDRTDSAERQIDRLGPDSGVKQQAFGTTNSVLVDDPASMRGANYQPNVRPEVGSAREHHDGVVVKAPPRSSSPRRLNGGDGHVRSAEVATVEPLAPKRSLSPRPVKVSERDLSNYQGSQSSNSELQRNVELKASPVDFTGDQSRRSREVPPDVNYLGASMIAPRRSRSPRPLLENHEKPPPRSQSPRPLSGVEGSSEFADTILYAVGETLVAPARSSRPVSLEARISVGSTGDGQTLPLPKRSNH